MPVKNDVKKRLGPGLDVRGDGSFVVAPPSLHKNGSRYEWLPGSAPWERELAELPAWLLAKLSEKERVAPPLRQCVRSAGSTRERRYAEGALEQACAAVASTPEGARNETLNREAFGIGQLVGASLLSRTEPPSGLLKPAPRIQTMPTGVYYQEAAVRARRAAAAATTRRNGRERIHLAQDSDGADRTSTGKAR